jgi:2-polyprenyl-3-methyl-5-hydroxy-6-metoxy-1,4-benzoquinol methylase
MVINKFSNLRTREEWIEDVGKHDIKPYLDIPFQDIFQRFVHTGGDLFEVGCYPGSFSIYLAENYKYRVSGIDFYPSYKERIIPELLNKGLQVGEYIEGDFLEYRPKSQYDLVCSFGFIEHFIDIEDIIRRHIDLVKVGGTLILTCPNFKGANYVLHKLLDEENLFHHNLDAMDLNLWKNILEGHNMQILFQDFYGTFGFWGGNNIKSKWKKFVVNLTSLVCNCGNTAFNHPSSTFSPYLVSVSKRIK